jgi:hypothetical protein
VLDNIKEINPFQILVVIDKNSTYEFVSGLAFELSLLEINPTIHYLDLKKEDNSGLEEEFEKISELEHFYAYDVIVFAGPDQKELSVSLPEGYVKGSCKREFFDMKIENIQNRDTDIYSDTWFTFYHRL